MFLYFPPTEVRYKTKIVCFILTIMLQVFISVNAVEYVHTAYVFIRVSIYAIKIFLADYFISLNLKKFYIQS